MDDFISLRLYARLTDQQCCNLFKVTPRTLRRWEQTRSPHLAILILESRANRLSIIGPEWSGFRIHENDIMTPEGSLITPGDLRTIPYMREAIRFYQDRASKRNYFPYRAFLYKAPKNLVEYHWLPPSVE